MALVLVFLEVGAFVVFLSAPDVVHVVGLRLLVGAEFDAVELEELAGVLVDSLDLELGGEDLEDLADAPVQRVEERLVDLRGVDGIGLVAGGGVEVHGLEELALDDSGVVLLLLDDLHLVRGEVLDDAVPALADALLVALEDAFAGLAVEHQLAVLEALGDAEGGPYEGLLVGFHLL